MIYADDQQPPALFSLMHTGNQYSHATF